MKEKSILLVLLIFALLWTFVVGAGLGWLIGDKNQPAPRPQPPIEIPGLGEEETAVQYDIIFVTKEENPRILSIGTWKKGNIQDGGAHYYNPKSGQWTNITKYIDTFSVTDDQGLNQLTSTITGTVEIENDYFAFNVDLIKTPMVVKAKERHVKFAGTTETTLVINDEKVPARVALLKDYNKDSVYFDLKEYGIETDWLVYWDENDNFYHLDITTMEKFNPLYEPHEFFAVLTPNNVIEHFENFLSVQNGDKVEITKNNEPVFILDLGPYYERGRSGIAKTYVASTNEGGIGAYLSIGN